MTDDGLSRLLEALHAEGFATRAELRERLGQLDESVLHAAVDRGLVRKRAGIAETGAASHLEAPEDEFLLTAAEADLAGRP